MFLAEGFFETYELPVSVEEMAVVNERFYLKPLFTLFRGDGRFYVLALSQKNVRFFEGSRYQLREIELPEDVPHRLEEVVGYQLDEQSLQFHSGTQASRANARGGSAPRAPRSPIYHGQGGGEQVQKDEVAKFFSRLDKALHDHLPSKNVPLVLAGVEWLQPIYRQTSEHQNLLDEGIHGNPDGWSADELHSRAWEIVRPQIIADRERAAERFGDLIGTGRASNRVEDVVAAAFEFRFMAGSMGSVVGERFVRGIAHAIGLPQLTFLNWFWLPLFPMFVIFFISALAETNRPPFDLPEAESELVAGYMVEYSSTPYLLLMLGEYVAITLMCAFATILFLGGWLPPIDIPPFNWLPGLFWFSAKLVFIFFLFAMVKAFVPRYRYDQLMRLGWKVFLPISLGWVALTAGVLVAFDLAP